MPKGFYEKKKSCRVKFVYSLLVSTKREIVLSVKERYNKEIERKRMNEIARGKIMNVTIKRHRVKKKKKIISIFFSPP